MSKKCKAFSESKLGLEPPDNKKAFYAGWDAALRAALEQEQDPELSAALGWPGGISDPVLDRKTLLQQVARLARERAHGIEEET